MTHSYYWKLFEATEARRASPPELIKSALSSSDAYDQWMGCKAAGVAPNVLFLSRLSEFATMAHAPSEPDLPSIAIWALARYPRDHIDELWKSWANNGQAGLRRAAADLIGEAKIIEAAPTLEVLLDDDDWQVFLWAALSLSKLADAGFEILASKLHDVIDGETFLVIADAMLKSDFVASQALIEAQLKAFTPEIRDALRPKLTTLLEQNRR